MVGELDSKLNAVPDPKPRAKRGSSKESKEPAKSGRRTAREKAIMLAQIREAERDGKSDSDIAKLLGVTLSAYYKTWVPLLYKQDKSYIETLSKQFIHHQLVVLRDRLTGILQRAAERANNTALTGGVRNDADRLVMEVSINLFKLVKDGPSVVGVKVQDLEAEDSKQQAKAESPSGQISAGDIKILQANPQLAGKLPGYGGLNKVILDEDTKKTDEMPEG